MAALPHQVAAPPSAEAGTPPSDGLGAGGSHRHLRWHVHTSLPHSHAMLSNSALAPSTPNLQSQRNMYPGYLGTTPEVSVDDTSVLFRCSCPPSSPSSLHPHDCLHVHSKLSQSQPKEGASRTPPAGRSPMAVTALWRSAVNRAAFWRPPPSTGEVSPATCSVSSTVASRSSALASWFCFRRDARFLRAASRDSEWAAATVPCVALPVASASNARLLNGSLREEDVSRRVASSTTEWVAHLKAVRSSTTAIPALRLKLSMICLRSSACTCDDVSNSFSNIAAKAPIACYALFGSDHLHLCCAQRQRAPPTSRARLPSTTQPEAERRVESEPSRSCASSGLRECKRPQLASSESTGNEVHSSRREWASYRGMGFARQHDQRATDGKNAHLGARVLSHLSLSPRANGAAQRTSAHWSQGYAFSWSECPEGLRESPLWRSQLPNLAAQGFATTPNLAARLSHEGWHSRPCARAHCSARLLLSSPNARCCH